jgi:hypothetical protein
MGRYLKFIIFTYLILTYLYYGNFSNLHVCEGYVGGRIYYAGYLYTTVVYGAERTRNCVNTGKRWSRQNFVQSSASYTQVN